MLIIVLKQVHSQMLKEAVIRQAEQASHAEGGNNEVSGIASHAEGTR